MVKRIFAMLTACLCAASSGSGMHCIAAADASGLHAWIEENGISYTYIGGENGGWAANIADAEAPDCVIPEQIQGEPVTEVYFTHENSTIVSITLPSTVAELSVMYCSELQEYQVSEQNERFSSADGVLYDKSGETLICYPPARDASSFAVPEGVQTLGAYAFYGCDQLTEVTLPESLKLIDTGAFSEMPHLTALTIPAQVAEVEMQYFDSALQTVTLCCEDTALLWDDDDLSWTYRWMFWEFQGFAAVYVPDELLKTYKGFFEIPIRDRLIEVLPMSEKPRGITGDVDCDGVCAVADAVQLRKWLLGAPDASLAGWRAGDLNADGCIDARDFSLIKQLLLQPER